MDLTLDDGRTLRVYDTGAGAPVIWHHGTPNVGSPPEPLFTPGVRWISYDRPSYGGSTPRPGRTIGSAAEEVAAVADALGLDRFAVMGHSGGGSHALACGALLGDRVTGVVSMAGLAPYDAEGLDWYAGMVPSGVASLRAAAAGRGAKVRHETYGPEYDPEFTPDDLAVLSGDWSWLGRVADAALAGGPGGLIDDDIAYTLPWGFQPGQITAPTLLVHGGRDRIVPPAHGEWLASRIPGAELRLSPGDGHISILTHAAAALERLR